MRVLVLGGTGFVGRAVVERLLTGGHEPVLFNRGTADLFPGVGRRVCDRRCPTRYRRSPTTRTDRPRWPVSRR